MYKESINNWSRGDLKGKWLPSEDDIDEIFDPHNENGPDTLRTCAAYMKQYHENTFVPFMNTFDAYRYCLPLRDRAIRNLCSLPWDTNLLNAFHNLHFTLFMADVNPSFGNDRLVDYTVPARQVWMLQLVYEAATECLRDDFIKLSEDKENYAIETLATHDHESVGILLQYANIGILELWVDFKPKVHKDGTFGFDYKLTLYRHAWEGKNSHLKLPLDENFKAMKAYVAAKLRKFKQTLKKAEFNSPDYALDKINGGNL